MLFFFVFSSENWLKKIDKKISVSLQRYRSSRKKQFWSKNNFQLLHKSMLNWSNLLEITMFYSCSLLQNRAKW
ncbi:hypothetical protein CJD36_002735 [Flavipsychrobacter stenotrophus]|uniref:Uncharacterized protein n=1 Tax=Flavipsychrobacter stenotrophus TaxID=2077091 RepID=A0A2S7T1E8_9BACT|nr:hypothetical protein CJD36_002735 [Flavipsychrobacter stenotrophus]